MPTTHVSKALTATLEQQTKAALPTTTPPLAENLLGAFQTGTNPELLRMQQEALNFCADLQARHEARWLSILGPSGTGKTMLAKLIKSFVMKQGRYYKLCAPGGDVMQTHPCYFASWPEMVQEMKRGDFSTVESLCEKWTGPEVPDSKRKKPIVWFAVIDDIGQVEDTSKAYLVAALSRIADARLGAWTVWTSNMSHGQIAERLDTRIASRMLRGENIVVKNTAVDFNLR